MKKITLLLFALFCLIAINAQKSHSSQIEELQQRIELIGDTSGSLYDYFTIEELELLKTNVTTYDTKIGGGITAFGINNGTPALSSFDTGDGTLTEIAASPIANFENAGAIDPSNNAIAYVLDNAGDFYSVDVNTGTYTFLGNIPGDWLGLEFNPNSGTLYALANGAGVSELHTIDISGLSSTLVGSTGIAVAIAIAIDGSGNAYSFGLDDFLYSIDLSTGVSTSIGAIGFDSNFGQGMFWDDVSDTFYMTVVDAGNGNSLELRSIDVSTGATTVIGITGAQVAWSSKGNQPTASIADNTIEGFEYFPNPTNNIINLRALNSINNVAIFNSLGQKVFNQSFTTNEGVLNIANLNTGIYIMKVATNNEVATYQIVKK